MMIGCRYAVDEYHNSTYIYWKHIKMAYWTHVNKGQGDSKFTCEKGNVSYFTTMHLHS